jgi:hypothetical protein
MQQAWTSRRANTPWSLWGIHLVSAQRHVKFPLGFIELHANETSFSLLEIRVQREAFVLGLEVFDFHLNNQIGCT